MNRGVRPLCTTVGPRDVMEELTAIATRWCCELFHDARGVRRQPPRFMLEVVEHRLGHPPTRDEWEQFLAAWRAWVLEHGSGGAQRAEVSQEERTRRAFYARMGWS